MRRVACSTWQLGSLFRDYDEEKALVDYEENLKGEDGGYDEDGNLYLVHELEKETEDENLRAMRVDLT